MPLKVQPISKSNLVEWSRMRYEVYKDSAVGVLWYHRPSDNSFQEMGESDVKLLSDPHVHIFKCIDTNLDDKMIAVAHWSVYDAERTPEEADEDLQPRPTWPEENRAARLDFLGGIFRSTREIMGTQPHVILESLSTYQDHHRRGAASLLMKWGVGEADRLRLVTYLAASEAGKPLYERFAVGTSWRSCIRWNKVWGREERSTCQHDSTASPCRKE